VMHTSITEYMVHNNTYTCLACKLEVRTYIVCEQIAHFVVDWCMLGA